MYQWQDYSWTRRNLQIGGLILPLQKKRPFFSSRRSQFSSWTSFPPLLMNVSLTCVSGPRFKAQRDEIEQKIPERSSFPPYFSGFLSLSPQSGPGEARNYLGGIFFSPGLPSFPPSVATLGFHFVSIASLWWRKKFGSFICLLRWLCHAYQDRLTQTWEIWKCLWEHLCIV